MHIGVLSLFPDMFRALTGFGVTGRAVDSGRLTLTVVNPRDYTTDKHRTVDDKAYGGGPGMVLKAEPLAKALAALRQEMAQKVAQKVAQEAGQGETGEAVPVVYLSPQGKPLKQAAVESFSNRPGMILIAGRYEGIDERFIELHVDEEWSIGDFVVSGGELPAMLMTDAIARLLPGVLGDELSAQQDSFSDGLLDCPHYTRPEQYAGLAVPPVLLGGNHEEIRRWRLQQALGRTWQRRPDLLEGRVLNDEQQGLLEQYQEQHGLTGAE